MYSSDFEGSGTLSTISRSPVVQSPEFNPLSDMGLSAQHDARDFSGFFPSPDEKHVYHQQMLSSSSVSL
jgi:hypothetical protein